ncbi:MAG: hypothetical protein KGJ80_11160 [Chloroflexota bacterium]|nr:hypothetical protein [Chloroflexota bacterium]
MKSLFFGCLSAGLGLIVGIVLALAATQFFQANSPQEIPPPPESQAEVSVTASASFINSQMQQAVRQSGLARQATITLAAPNVIRTRTLVDLTIAGQSISVNVTAAMSVTVQKGRITLTVDKVDAGGIAVPQSAIGSTVEKMRALAEDQINRMVQRALQGTALRVSNVRVTPMDLTVDLVSQ